MCVCEYICIIGNSISCVRVLPPHLHTPMFA